MMNTYYHALFFLLLYFIIIKADISNKQSSNVDLLPLYSGEGYVPAYPVECLEALEEFAQYASDFTKCSILYARPIRLCEQCINEYMNFRNKYQELLTTVANGTISCKSLFISQDRLDAVLGYHDNILSIWDKGHCYACYNWSNPVPVLSNETKHFNTLFNGTMTCIEKYKNISPNISEVCDKCMQDYLQLDKYYKTLSADAIGVDSICMDIVDSMNTTRSIWSKTLNCCKVRRTPEVIFLCSAGILSALPLLYYIVLRYCGPIRDFPNVLKQSRFKQMILRSSNGRRN